MGGRRRREADEVVKLERRGPAWVLRSSLASPSRPRNYGRTDVGGCIPYTSQVSLSFELSDGRERARRRWFLSSSCHLLLPFAPPSPSFELLTDPTFSIARYRNTLRSLS